MNVVQPSGDISLWTALEKVFHDSLSGVYLELLLNNQKP